MNDSSHGFENTSAHAELSGVLLESVKEILREPMEERDLARALDRARQLANATMPDRPRPTRRLSHNHILERVKRMILAHKRLSVVAATVAALAASEILYIVLFSSSMLAYALEQTAQANDRITSYHVKITPPVPEGRAKGVGEFWVQLNPDGTFLRGRVDRFPTSNEPNHKATFDDDRVTFGSKDRIEFWSKAKNLHIICTDKDKIKKGLDEFMKSRASFDPKLAIEELQADEKTGKVQVATKEPVKEGEPITLTVTSNDKPDRRQVYEVNPKSKLVERVIEYRGNGDQWKQVSQRDYLDYNKEINPKVFQPELPKDITTIDLSKIDRSKSGLAQGDLTDDQIATKVAKECLEAIIAGDYQKAGQLYGGMPGGALKNIIEQQKIKFLRIVEIGKAFHDARYPGLVSVPVKVEVEIKGKKTVEEKKLFVGPVGKNSDRWSVGGGL